MPKHLLSIALAFVLVGFVVFSGCESGSTASQNRSDAAGETFVLQEIPAAHSTIGAAQEEIKSIDDPVVVKGWVDLNALEGKKNSAVFMLREILDDGHGGESHDPSSCPFCKRRMNAAPKAVIAFRDNNNEVIKRNATDLLPIEHGDIVIVKGTGVHDAEFKLLKLNASGIYLVKD